MSPLAVMLAGGEWGVVGDLSLSDLGVPGTIRQGIQ